MRFRVVLTGPGVSPTESTLRGRRKFFVPLDFAAIRKLRMTSLSVLVPVYNEQHLVAASLARLGVLESSPHLEQIQVIVVDDCSTDRTREELRSFTTTRGLAWRDDAAPVDGASLTATGRAGKIDWMFLRHVRNGGKGCAIRTALAHAQCAITVIHDADLEYDPSIYSSLRIESG